MNREKIVWNVAVLAAFMGLVGCDVGLKPYRIIACEEACGEQVRLDCDGHVVGTSDDAFCESCVADEMTWGLSCDGWMETDCAETISYSCADQYDGVPIETASVEQACLEGGYSVGVHCESPCVTTAGSIEDGEQDVRPWCDYTAVEPEADEPESAEPPASPPPPSEAELRRLSADLSIVLGSSLAVQHEYAESSLRARMARIGLGTYADRAVARFWAHRVIDVLAARAAARAQIREALRLHSTGQISAAELARRASTVLDPLLRPAQSI